VLGHTDSTGSERHNIALSLRRADVVERALIAAGVAPERVGVAAAGETRLRVATGDGIAEPRNRRVELLFQPFVGW
jgi:outer membrane protein OmpA-like peptidoglycan-associated protein